VQGFGAVGYWASNFTVKDGGKITTVVEYNSAIHNPDGFDPDDVRAWMQEHGTLKDYPHAVEAISENPQ
jgi:glutamate dehydrogenase/leucine dehydrogenase